MKIIPTDISVAKLHHYLLGAVSPRPIALVSTVDQNGVSNLSPFSFFNIFSANPPIAIFSPARRGRDNSTKHTYENIKKHPQCVINVVNFDMVQQTSLSSTEYAQGVDEFIKSGFTPIQSELVTPFRVKESPVQLECEVQDVVELGTEGGAGNLIIAKIICIHIHDDILNTQGEIDPNKIDLVGRMGGDWYCRASGSALFEVPKPLTSIGIGVDQIPFNIRNSKILTGNDLGKLGNILAIPNETDVNEYKLLELSDVFMQFEGKSEALEQELHTIAQKHLKENKTLEAWKTLLSFND